MIKQKILLFDIETAPMEGFFWDMWDQNIALNQITKDWSVLAWAAKWLGDPASKIMYADQRRAKNKRDDKKLLQGIWKLLDEADIVITQNGISFDAKKLNARFFLNGMKPPSSYRHIDTKRISSQKFGFTSNRLEYLTSTNKKYKKLKHKKFPGFELWRECLNGNLKAWKEMETYNKYDVLSLEEFYKRVQPWVTNFNISPEDAGKQCNCGSKNIRRNGFSYSSLGKYQRFACADCGAEIKSSINILKRKSRNV